MKLISFHIFDRDHKNFYLALIISFAVHLIAVIILSPMQKKLLQKPLKKIEVTYNSLKPKKVASKNIPVDKIKISKDIDHEKNVKILSKKMDHNTAIEQHLKDISKVSGQVTIDKKPAAMIKALDMSRKVTVPLLKAEKITNPKYISYNQSIRHRIKQQAYAYIDHPDFEAGEVYLTFVLGSNGQLKQIQIIESKTSANEYLKRIGLRSIKESNPFAPFPEDLRYPELTFNVVISFEIKE